MKARSDGTTLISLYHFICAALSLLGICVACAIVALVIIAAASDPSASDAAAAVAVISIIALLIGGLLLVVAAANLVVGWGLWKGREWARVGALALAIFRLFNIPLGTIIGGLIIWYLLRPDVKAEFSS
jgi:hypothetical protein